MNMQKLKEKITWMTKRRGLNSRGAINLNMVGGFMIGFLVLAFTAVAVFLGISTLRTSSIFPTGSAEANGTANISSQLVSGVTTFFSFTTTLFSVLAVVLILGVIGLLIFVAYSFYNGRQGSTDVL